MLDRKTESIFLENKRMILKIIIMFFGVLKASNCEKEKFCNQMADAPHVMIKERTFLNRRILKQDLGVVKYFHFQWWKSANAALESI